MLRLHPDKRAKASDLVHHNWLDGILVQGEIDVIRRAEEDEARKKRREAAGVDAMGGGGMSPNSSLKAALDQSEADAMKPVDDIAALSDMDKVGPGPQPPHTYHPPKLSNAPVSSSSTAKENAAARPPSSGSAGAGAAMSSPRSRPTSSAKSTSSSAKR